MEQTNEKNVITIFIIESGFFPGGGSGIQGYTLRLVNFMDKPFTACVLTKRGISELYGCKKLEPKQTSEFLIDGYGGFPIVDKTK